MSENNPPFYPTPEQKESAKLQIFYNYLHNLGLKENDLKNKCVLDIGASGGAFGDIAMRFGSQVVSIDMARPKDCLDVLEGQSKKIFELSAEDLNLKDRLGLEQEPRFDYVVSHFSTPYVLVNNGQDKNGAWKDGLSSEERSEFLYEKIAKSIQNIFLHLKIGGRAILYPLFLNLDNEEAMAVDFTHGEKRDVRELNSAVHVVLADLYSSYKDKFDLTMENVPQKEGVELTRLTIIRRA